ncbi:prefoldin subunit [Candidatus Micrarchaeota archaeon]|nr:prefoldin subunit [Candidatus Micrarchaeota archaeon]
MSMEEDIGAMQQQMQFLMFQRQNFEMQNDEYKTTKSRLADIKGDIFKIEGPLLIPVSKTDAEKELDEKLENNAIKIKALKKQEEQIKEKVNEMVSEYKGKQ